MSKEAQRQESVFEACRRVIERGLPLTARNVRDELGGGSFTTLVPHINAYRSKISGETAIRGSLPPPPQELENLTKKMTLELWLKVRMINEAEIKESTAKFERRLASLQADLDLAKEEVAGHAAEIQKLEEAFSISENRLQEQRRRLAEKEGQIQLVTSQLEQRDLEIKALLERAIRAEAKLSTENAMTQKPSRTSNGMGKEA
ncbi:MAG: hypothetical protein HC902_08615 [Calothrix sp. SM1_5_4]|nr:hypothetical protein [Calothrix sp. SM1_5_4]